MGLDVHLKVLQTLPALIQNYSKNLKGELLFGVLQICSALQAVKNPAVGSTAAATLQQLLSSVFENVAIEDSKFSYSCQYVFLLVLFCLGLSTKIESSADTAPLHIPFL